jgi:hypothetical protein
MPLEALACTQCGSADVKEVKPSTYFCNHCDTVFKQVDPGKVSVAVAPSFCLCGNPVTAQCQICHVSTMCFGGCNATSSWLHPWPERSHWVNICFPTVGFGYVLSGLSSWKEVAGGRIVARSVSEPAMVGPSCRQPSCSILFSKLTARNSAMSVGRA